MEKINVKITFLEGPLGTAPNDEDVYRNFIGSKAPDAATIEDEVAALGADAVVEKGMTVFQRPLRAQTMQGERVTLAMSEECPANSTISFTVLCLSPEHVAAVREWLNYGYLRGLGQWRNSGRGKFVWEELDDNGAVIGGNASLSGIDRLALVS